MTSIKDQKFENMKMLMKYVYVKPHYICEQIKPCNNVKVVTLGSSIWCHRDLPISNYGAELTTMSLRKESGVGSYPVASSWFRDSWPV